MQGFSCTTFIVIIMFHLFVIGYTYLIFYFLFTFLYHWRWIKDEYINVIHCGIILLILFSYLMLLVRWQKGHPAKKVLSQWFPKVDRPVHVWMTSGAV